MQISGTNPVHSAQPIRASQTTRSVSGAAAPGSSAPVDELDLSNTNQILAKVHELPEIRQERVTALRAAIAQGTYETPEKLEAALDRMLDEMA